MSLAFDIALQTLLDVAKTEGISRTELFNVINGRLPGETFDDQGVSTPDERGFVHFRRIDKLRSDLEAQGLGFVVEGNPANPEELFRVDPLYACVPGLAQLKYGSDNWQQITTDITWADKQTLSVAMAGKAFEYEKVNHGFGDSWVQKPDGNGNFVTIPGVTALPASLKTPDACVLDILKRVQDHINGLNADPSLVDFSPLPALPPRPSPSVTPGPATGRPEPANPPVTDKSVPRNPTGVPPAPLSPTAPTPTGPSPTAHSGVSRDSRRNR